MSVLLHLVDPSLDSSVGAEETDAQCFLFITLDNQTQTMNETQEGMADFGHPVMVSLSVSSLLFNLLVVRVLRAMMRGRRTQLQTQLQLLILAVSDLSVGVAFVWAAGWHFLCDVTQPCRQAKPCLYNFVAWFFVYAQIVGFNHSITIYVTYARAKALGGIRGARDFQEMTPRRTVVELIAYSLSLHLLTNAVTFGAAYLFQSFDLAFFVILVAWTLLVAAMTAFIFYRLWLKRKRSPLPLGGAGAAGEVQKLAASVSLVFCCCQIVQAACNGYRFFTDSADDPSLLYFIDLEILANSTVNLFIYLLGSSSFRRFFRLLFVGEPSTPTKTPTATETTTAATRTTSV